MGYWLAPNTLFEEMACRMPPLHGETTDTTFWWTIFDGAPDVYGFQTVKQYLGRAVYTEELIGRAKWAWPASTRLTWRRVVYPVREF